MYMECYLSAEAPLGVHIAGGSEGIIEQNKSISLHIEGQVRTNKKRKIAIKHADILSALGSVVGKSLKTNNWN